MNAAESLILLGVIGVGGFMVGRAMSGPTVEEIVEPPTPEQIAEREKIVDPPVIGGGQGTADRPQTSEPSVEAEDALPSKPASEERVEDVEYIEGPTVIIDESRTSGFGGSFSDNVGFGG